MRPYKDIRLSAAEHQIIDLLRYLTPKSRDGWVDIKRAEIARRIHRGKATIPRALNNLKAYGYVRDQVNMQGPHVTRHSRFHLVTPRSDLPD